MRYIILLLCVVFLKILINISKLIQLSYLKSRYEKFLKGELDIKFIEYAPRIIKLFDGAKLKNPPLQRKTPTGIGYADVFSNMHLTDIEIVAHMRLCFLKSKGTYKSNIYDSINPVWWLEFAMYAPQNLIKYLGITTPGSWVILIKVLNIIYWIFVISFLLTH